MLKSLINFENHLFFEKKFIKQVPREKKEFLYVDVDLWRSRRLKMAVLEHTKWRIREPQNTRCYGDAQREKRNYYDTSPPPSLRLNSCYKRECYGKTVSLSLMDAPSSAPVPGQRGPTGFSAAATQSSSTGTSCVPKWTFMSFIFLGKISAAFFFNFLWLLGGQG